MDIHCIVHWVHELERVEKRLIILPRQRTLILQFAGFVPSTLPHSKGWLHERSFQPNKSTVHIAMGIVESQQARDHFHATWLIVCRLGANERVMNVEEGALEECNERGLEWGSEDELRDVTLLVMEDIHFCRGQAHMRQNKMAGDFYPRIDFLSGKDDFIRSSL